MIRYRVKIDNKMFIFEEGIKALQFAETARETAMDDNGRVEIIVDLVTEDKETKED